MLRLLVLPLALWIATPTHAADLEAGDPAPEFLLTGSDGRSRSLADFAGKSALVLAWFPKAFTPG